MANTLPMVTRLANVDLLSLCRLLLSILLDSCLTPVLYFLLFILRNEPRA